MDFSQESCPFVLPQEALACWPCLHWSPHDWASKFAKLKWSFRVHKTSDQQVSWEHKAEAYIDATLEQLLDHLSQKKQTANNQPFAAFPPNEYCFYSGYNHMKVKLDPELHKEIMQSIKWVETSLDEPRLVNHGSESTIWIGTGNAYTPCHMDTYGYNFVAQLCGKKRWILFPPSDTDNLYPTRIPYEESSIFSLVNLQSIDLQKYDRMKHTRPRIVELSAGQVLFVPHHWWHFVENLCAPDMISISVNCWVSHGPQSILDSNSCITESLVQFLARPLFDTYGDATWLNQGADLFSAQEAQNMLLHLLNSDNNTNKNASPEMLNKTEKVSQKKVKSLHRQYLPEGCFEELIRIKPICDTTQRFSDRPAIQEQVIQIHDIVNAILNPDVIHLIKSKLFPQEKITD